MFTVHSAIRIDLCADRLSEPEDDRTTTNDAESPSSPQSPSSALVPALEVAAPSVLLNAAAVNDPTPFQPKDTTTIARTRSQQGQKGGCFALLGMLLTHG